MRARLQDIQVLQEGSQRPAEYEPLEPDPIDEPEPVVVKAPPPQPAPKSAEKPAEMATVEGDCTDYLYDEEILEAIKGGQPVKLDLSVDRTKLRQQNADLIQRGYSFDAKAQTYFRK